MAKAKKPSKATQTVEHDWPLFWEQLKLRLYNRGLDAPDTEAAAKEAIEYGLGVKFYSPEPDSDDS